MGHDADSDPQAAATPEQEAQARDLAEQVGEDVPHGMRQAEAAQRIEELATQSQPPQE